MATVADSRSAKRGKNPTLCQRDSANYVETDDSLRFLLFWWTHADASATRGPKPRPGAAVDIASCPDVTHHVDAQSVLTSSRTNLKRPWSWRRWQVTGRRFWKSLTSLFRPQWRRPLPGMPVMDGVKVAFPGIAPRHRFPLRRGGGSHYSNFVLLFIIYIPRHRKSIINLKETGISPNYLKLLAPRDRFPGEKYVNNTHLFWSFRSKLDQYMQRVFQRFWVFYKCSS